MRLMVRFAGWQAYVATNLANAEIVEAEANDHVKALEARYLLDHPATGDAKITRIRTEMSGDLDIQAARETSRRAYALRKRLSVLHEKYDRGGNLLSRELTRRTSGNNAQRGEGFRR